MVSQRPRRLWPGLALGALVLVCAWWFWPSAASKPAATRKAAATRSAQRSHGPQLVAIDLARLDTRGDALKAGKRDLFDFAPPPPPPPTPAPPPPGPPTTLSKEDQDKAAEIARRPPPPVPLNVKYIGAMEDKQQGLKVAILLTDRQEILTGRPGEIVANRLKIVAIGLESVDVQDVGAPNVRRIALKGN
jgi:hypothetical protein